MAAATAVICVDDEWGAKMAAIVADPTTVATVDHADRVDPAARRWTAVGHRRAVGAARPRRRCASTPGTAAGTP